MKNPVVDIIKTNPQSVLKDIPELMEPAGIKNALDSNAETILKDNISWHYPFMVRISFTFQQ